MKKTKIINGVKCHYVANSCIKTREYSEWMPEKEYKKQVKEYQEFEFQGGKPALLRYLNEGKFKKNV